MKNKVFAKIASLALCGTMVAGLFTGCGSKASSDTSYTMWMYSGADANYYTDYADNPVVQYLESQTWGTEDKNVDIEFWIPASGTAADSFSTMMGSGDYPDILDCSILSETPKNYYEQGTFLDLTEEVKENMPNYLAFLEKHPELHNYAVTDVDGEEKYLTIMGVNEDYPYTYCGYQYRRDWIVKYGTNPTTGAKFTGGYTDADDPDSWEDDVVFPSGGTDPVYISDWEWMFDIFEKAYADLGINDTYAISMYYPGYTWTGDLCSSFGGGNMSFSLANDGSSTVIYGPVTDQARAYFQCMNTWYEKGWLDKDFNQRTADMFYSIDDTTVRQGKVGMWCGMQAELGGRLDSGDEYTDGIYVAGCALPMNDIYGTDACKNVEPNCIMTGTGLNGTSYAFTSAAEGKDIGTILSMFDYLYSDEGALMRTCGLDAEQIETCGTDFYANNNVEDGMYKKGSDGRYEWVSTVKNDSGSLKGAGGATKLPGLTLVSSIDEGYAPTYEKSMQAWIKYKNKGQMQGTPVTSNMSQEDSDAVNPIFTKCLDQIQSEAYNLITGDTDINDDAAWDTWCKKLKKLNYEKALKIYQPYADKYPVTYSE